MIGVGLLILSAEQRRLRNLRSEARLGELIVYDGFFFPIFAGLFFFFDS